MEPISERDEITTRPSFKESRKKHRGACNECYLSFAVLVRYVTADLSRKKSAFQIGVFTVFLVVTFITMLKGVIDAMPVLFL